MVGGILLLSPCKIPWIRQVPFISVISERKVVCKNNLHALSCLRTFIDDMYESISSMMNLSLNRVSF